MIGYRVSVYFAQGITAWQGNLDQRDVTFSIDVPWLWLARYFARGNIGNRGRLAYAIHCGNELVEEHKPEPAP